MSIEIILKTIKIIIRFSNEKKHPSSGENHFPYYLTWAQHQNIVFPPSKSQASHRFMKPKGVWNPQAQTETGKSLDPSDPEGVR